MNKKSVLLFLAANNFNETEYVSVRNELIKNDIQIFITSDSDRLCEGNNGLRVRTDISIFNVHPINFAGFIIIGGNGIKKYWYNSNLHQIVIRFNYLKKIIGAICNATVILAKAGILMNRNATCFEEGMKEFKIEKVVYSDFPIVEDENIITAKNPLSAQSFAKTFTNKILKEV